MIKQVSMEECTGNCSFMNLLNHLYLCMLITGCGETDCEQLGRNRGQHIYVFV